MLCERCDGVGELPCPNCTDHIIEDTEDDIDCEACGDYGFITCPECGGTGELGEIEA